MRIDDYDIKDLSGLDKSTTLESLDVTRCCLERLPKFARLINLSSLCIKFCKLRTCLSVVDLCLLKELSMDDFSM